MLEGLKNVKPLLEAPEKARLIEDLNLGHDDVQVNVFRCLAHYAPQLTFDDLVALRLQLTRTLFRNREHAEDLIRALAANRMFLPGGPFSTRDPDVMYREQKGWWFWFARR